MENNESEKRNNFDENVHEEVPQTPYQEIVRPISKRYGRPVSKKAAENKAACDRKALAKRRARNKRAKAARKKNRRK